jgi:hypothetical protein
MKCALFTKEDHEKYDDLTTYNLDTVNKLWAEAYKAHTTYIRSKTGANEYESAAYAGTVPTNLSTAGYDNESYTSTLKETVARLMTECKEALTLSTRATTTTPAMSATPTDLRQQIMTDVKTKMIKVVAAAMAAAKATDTNTPDGSGIGGRGGGGSRNRKKQIVDTSLPKCPNCRKHGTHKPNDAKIPSNFVDGKFSKPA